MADSEWGGPDSYSSFQGIICLSRLVLETFVSEKQTDRPTTWNITIAAPPPIVAGLLKIDLNI